MKLLRTILLLPLLLSLHAPETAAQRAGGGAPVPFVGLAIGGSSLPAAFAGCSSDMRSAGEIRAGLSWGTVAVEARGAGLVAGFDDCLIILREELRLPGTFPAVEYPFERGDVHTAAELRVRYAPASSLPLVVAAGAGWLAPQDVPYLATSAGLRTRGRVQFALDLDHSWFRVPYDVVVREYGPYGESGPVLSSERYHDWRAGLGMRLGAEIPLR
ncbi:MAG: hypothetical protein M3P51_05075 [Chloroflexota bacterium]|nr:hypothetical protein [Chloroflexota bacterium]